MSKKKTTKKTKKLNNTQKIVVAVGAVVIIAIGVIFFTSDNDNAKTVVQQNVAGDVNKTSETSSAGKGITITKSEVSETATFIPYQVGDTKMEVIAVKAPDGTIRTALNTCQVCYDSGRGYYVQEGEELVCQNCGNRFKISQIEKQKNGCNPVPILSEDKTEDATTITISDDLLSQSVVLFAEWKK